MGTCSSHPERETSYQCLKHRIHLCEECLVCRDPELYCKHRSACTIHFMTRKGGKDWLNDSEVSGDHRRRPPN